MTNRHGGSCGCVNGARACWLDMGGVPTDSRGRGDRCVGERVGMETASWWGGGQRMRSGSTHLGRLNHISPIITISSDLQICAVVWFALSCFCTWLCVSGAPGSRSVVGWEVESRTQEWNVCGGLVERYIKEPTSRSALRVALFYRASSMRRRRSGSTGLPSACSV